MRNAVRWPAVMLLAIILPLCAFRAHATPLAWGYNHRGQLGDGTTTDRNAAVPVAGLPAGVSIVQADAGFWYSLAVGSNGKVYAWGYNYFGQLGDGSTTDRLSPVETAPLADGVRAVAVAAGIGHSLALGSDGGVYAWGDNQLGQLGTGGTATRTKPARVPLPNDARAAAVAAGENHSMALGTNGVVYAWGWNEAGQVGDGSYIDAGVPTAVAGLPAVKFTAIAAGGMHSLALDENGNLYGWGQNSYGQLADGSYATRTMPVRAKGFPAGVSIRAVAAGKYHTLAIGSDNTAYAWGSNDSGELGDGSAGIFAYRTEPAPVTGFPEGVTAASIAAGAYFSLATGSDGKAYAWGYNYNGQLGDGTNTNRKQPAPVAGIQTGDSVRHLSGGGFHALAVAGAAPPLPEPVARGLALAGGLSEAAPDDVSALDAVPGDGVNLLDVARLLRRQSGLDPRD